MFKTTIAMLLLATACTSDVREGELDQGLWADEQYCSYPAPTASECYGGLATDGPSPTLPDCTITCGTSAGPGATVLEQNRANHTYCGLTMLAPNVYIGQCVRPTW